MHYRRGNSFLTKSKNWDFFFSCEMLWCSNLAFIDLARTFLRFLSSAWPHSQFSFLCNYLFLARWGFSITHAVHSLPVLINLVPWQTFISWSDSFTMERTMKIAVNSNKLCLCERFDIMDVLWVLVQAQYPDNMHQSQFRSLFSWEFSPAQTLCGFSKP